VCVCVCVRVCQPNVSLPYVFCPKDTEPSRLSIRDPIFEKSPF
jgi:hypothetical protein